MADRYLSVRDFARRFDLAEQTVYRLVRSGELPAVRFGRAIRIAADASTDTGTDG